MNRGMLFCLALAGVMLTACGGGGGGGDGGGNNPPPPPPPASVTYELQITDIVLVDTRTDAEVDATGLPISSAVASRQN